MPDPLPFEFLVRANQFVGIPDQMQAQLIDERDRDLEDYLATLAVTTWTDLVLTAPWVEFDATQTPQIRRNGDRTELRGSVKSGTAATNISTVDAQYRPPNNVGFAVPCNTSTGIGHIDISSAGVLHLVAAAAITQVRFDAIAYSVTE